MFYPMITTDILISMIGLTPLTTPPSIIFRDA